VKADVINHIGKDQFGFRKDKGTRDAIATLRVLGERSLQRGKDLCICSVDYEKAFDRVDWRKTMWMLKDIGVDWRDRNLIAKLYLAKEHLSELMEKDCRFPTGTSIREETECYGM